MNFEDNEAALLQEYNKIDTFYLSFKHAFLKGFEESFYKKSLDDQIVIIMEFVDDVYLVSELEKLTKNNAKSFFRDLFNNQMFLKKFEHHFASSLDEKAFQESSRIGRLKAIKGLIDDGIDLATIARITKLTLKEIQELKENSQDQDGMLLTK